MSDDNWEPAARVQKNSEGEYRALIGDSQEWVPVEKAQKNDKGQYRVQRPQSGWASSLGNAVMRGGEKAASVIPLIGGGIADIVSRFQSGEQRAKSEGLRDKHFGAFDDLNKQADEYWQPEGRESTAQKMVGGVAEHVLPLMAAGGNPGPDATLSALGKGANRVQQGQNAWSAVAKAPIEGLASYAAMKMPLNIGGGIKGLGKAAAAQTGIAGAEEIDKAAVDMASYLLANDKQSLAEAKDILKDYMAPNLAATFVANAGMSAIVSALGRIPGGYKKLIEMKKARVAQPAPSAAPSAAPRPAVSPAPTMPAKDIISSLQSGRELPKGSIPPPQAEATTPEQDFASAKEVMDQFVAEGGNPAASAPPVIIVTPSAPVRVAAPTINRAAALPEDAGKSREGTELSTGRQIYGQHPVAFQTDLDRAAFFLDHPEYDIRTVDGRYDQNGIPVKPKPTKEVEEEYLKFIMDNTGMTEAEARAYGRQIRRDVVGKHAEHVANGKKDQSANGKKAGNWNHQTIYLDEFLPKSDAPVANPSAHPAATSDNAFPEYGDGEGYVKPDMGNPASVEDQPPTIKGTPQTTKQGYPVTYGDETHYLKDQAQIDAWVTADHEYNKLVLSSFPDPETRARMVRAAGERRAEIRRKILNRPTAKEHAKAEAREKSNYVGKKVSVGGWNGEVVGNSFGKVRIKFEDGRILPVMPDHISPPVAHAPTSPPPGIPKTRDIKKEVRGWGGIETNHPVLGARSVTGDNNWTNSKSAFNGVWRKGGLSGHDLAQKLIDDGWLPENALDYGFAGKHGNVEDEITAILRGEQMHPADEMAMAEYSAKAHDADVERATQIDRLIQDIEEAHVALLGRVDEHPEHLDKAVEGMRGAIEKMAERIRSMGGSESEVAYAIRKAIDPETNGSVIVNSLQKAFAGIAGAGLIDSASANDGSEDGTSGWTAAKYILGGVALAYAGAVGVSFLREFAGQQGLANASKSMAMRMFNRFTGVHGRQEALNNIATIRDETAAKINFQILRLGAWGRENAPGKSLMDWIRNGPGQDQAAFDVMKQAYDALSKNIQQLKWKQPVQARALPFAPTIGSMSSIWDMKDAKTLAAFHDFLANKDPKKNFPMFQFDFSAIKAGLDAGLKLVSNDPWEVFANFAHEAAAAQSNGQMMIDLFNARLHLPGNPTALMPFSGTRPPDGYVRLGENWGGAGRIKDFDGMAVHESLVPSMKMTFNTYEPGKFMSFMLGMSYAAKRVNVFGSAFHMVSLGQAGVSNALANGDISALNVARGLEYIRGQKTYLLPDGRDAMELLMIKGLKADAPLENLMGRKESLEFIEKIGERIDSGFGINLGGKKAAGGIKAYDNAMNKATWDVTYAGFKAEVAMRHLEKEIAKNPGKSVDKIAEECAEYANDLFGGINWRRIGEGAQTKLGQTLASVFFSAQGKAVMDAFLFAPDWLISTSRVWVKAVKPSVDEKGKRVWTEANWRYAKQLMGGAISTIILCEGIQRALTGTDVWDNEPAGKHPNPAMKALAKLIAMMEVDYGDGTRLNLGKHYKDFLSLILDPLQEGMYKLGVAPSEAIAQVENRQWGVAGMPGVAGGHYAPPMTYAEMPSPYAIRDRAEHIAGRFTPFMVQSNSPEGLLSGSGLGRAGLGAFGVPLRGMSKSERAEASRNEKARKKEETE